MTVILIIPYRRRLQRRFFIGGITMARIYADLIRKGIKTIDDVPAKLRDEVEKLLKE